MNFYLVLLVTSCVVSAVCATTILTRDPAHAANRRAAALVYGGSFWAFCEVLWNSASDPGVVLALVRLSALGWVWIGPLGLGLLLEVTSHPAPRLRRGLPFLFAFSAVTLILDWTTPWVHTGVVPTTWGWAYSLGPFWPVFYAVTVSCLGTGLVLGLRVYRRSPSSAERRQIRWIGAGIAIPLVIASLTDGILPFLGVRVPHLGTAAFAALGATVALSLYRYGTSLLAPGHFTREIVETMRDGLALLHLDGRIRSANQSLGRLAGCEAGELIGTAWRDLVDAEIVDPPREVHDLECELRCGASRPTPISISSAILGDRQGINTGLAVVVRDLREVVTLRQRLLLSGRMAAVGQLAAGVAHEINNPMAYVGSNLKLLRQHWQSLTSGDGPEKGEDAWRELLAEGEDLIDESLDGVARTIDIVREIKGFSHAGDGRRERVDINALLDSVQRVAAPQLRHRTRIERDDGVLPPVPCAGQEIQQVFLNLVLNAVDAAGDAGNIRIRTEHRGEWIHVHVEDDGCGIEPAALDRIFDPFFTTKAVGEGTGLGLAISYEIIRRHGGDITVSSEPGRGTSFCVTLPVGSIEVAADSAD